MLVKVHGEISVNPEHVASLVWDRRHYANVGPDSTLVITLASGEVHRVKHEPQYGTDAYAVEAKIKVAIKGARQKLVDLCFEFAITATEIQRARGGDRTPNEEIAAWVTKSLDGCGFKTVPRGMSWGVLKED